MGIPSSNATKKPKSKSPKRKKPPKVLDKHSGLNTFNKVKFHKCLIDDNGPLLGQRHLQTLLLFLALLINFNAKLNASVSVVAMTNAAITNLSFPEYDWTEMQRSLIISSFFWGNFVTQFPGGYMCRRYGVKNIMLISTFGGAFLASVIPISVKYGGWQAYCIIRILQGLFEGLLIPCVYAHLATWCPPKERNRLGVVATTGMDCGTMFAMFGSGMLAASAIGWPGISYISAAMGGVWCFLWLIFSANTPKESKYITHAEKLYIEYSKNALKQENVNSITTASLRIPWRAILTSGPFFAYLTAKSCHSWGFFTLQAAIPVYMNSILGMDIKSNALFSTLPFLATLCMSYIFLISSDILLNNNILSLNVVRKIFNSLTFLSPATGLIALSFLGKEQKTLAVVIMTISVGLSAAITIGSSLNAIDLSPNHAGILMGISNTFASIVPIVTPLFVGLILRDETDRTQWQIIFITTAVICIIINFVFVIFGSTNLQPWDDENFLVSKNFQSDECNKSGEILRT